MYTLYCLLVNNRGRWLDHWLHHRPYWLIASSLFIPIGMSISFLIFPLLYLLSLKDQKNVYKRFAITWRIIPSFCLHFSSFLFLSISQLTYVCERASAKTQRLVTTDKKVRRKEKIVKTAGFFPIKVTRPYKGEHDKLTRH